MFKVEAYFNDFDLYNDAIKNWDLDFRLLSKNDFSAYLNIFTNQNFNLARTKLSGKIEQFGLTPIGFRSIVIPVNYNSQFVWLNKKVSGDQILLFPKNGVLDGVSFNEFDIYILSIKESLLFETMDNLDFKSAIQFFNGDEQRLFMSRSFACDFHQLATHFLNHDISNLVQQKKLIDRILFMLLKYLEESSPLGRITIQRKRDKALKMAVEIINIRKNDNLSIQELCKLTGVSERTLEYAFKEKYGITPGQYIKANRLHRVKTELILSRGYDIKIATLAGKYGFWHMGQFAADFKNQFGILPSDLLIR